MKCSQQGIGLVEVLVALSLLSIAVLGYSALQLRAMAATQDATQNIQAMNLARDLAERMRVNRAGFRFYKPVNELTQNCAAPVTESGSTVGFCTAQQMAEYDYEQVRKKAEQSAMQIAILDCQATTLRRQCIYISWDETTPTNGDGAPNCTRGAAYVANSKCIIVETYNNVE